MHVRALIVSSAIVLVAAGCGSGEPATPVTQKSTTTTAAGGPDLSGASFTDQTGKAEVQVLARDNTFVSQYVEVSAGTKVTFANKGQQPHDVLPATDGSFTGIQPEDFQPGDSGVVTFDEPGDYSYYCSLHGTPTKGMTGTVRVLA